MTLIELFSQTQNFVVALVVDEIGEKRKSAFFWKINDGSVAQIEAENFADFAHVGFRTCRNEHRKIAIFFVLIDARTHLGPSTFRDPFGGKGTCMFFDFMAFHFP